MANRAPAILPIGLNRKEAAAYIGVGTTLFDRMVADGRMPCPIEINSRRVWDRQEIENHFRALKDGGASGAPDDDPESDWEAA